MEDGVTFWMADEENSFFAIRHPPSAILFQVC